MEEQGLTPAPAPSRSGRALQARRHRGRFERVSHEQHAASPRVAHHPGGGPFPPAGRVRRAAGAPPGAWLWRQQWRASGSLTLTAPPCPSSPTQVHGDEASSAAAKHAAELRDRDAHASELAESLRDAREGSSALARALRASGAKVEALQVQLSEAELARSKLVVQLCDAEQRGDAPLPPAALPPPLAAAMTQALSFGPPAATEPQPEVLPDEGAGEQLSRGALQLPQGAGGSSAQPLLPLPLPARGRERGSIVEEGSSAAALLPGMNPDSRVLDHLQTSSPAPVAGAATGAAKSPPALMRGRSTPGAVGPVAAAAAAKPSFMPGSEEALACDALASLLGEA